MDIFKQFKTDRRLEEQGVWVPLADGARIKVARVGNARYRETVRQLMAPHRAAARSGALPDEVQDTVTIQAMAAGLLLDWDGLVEDGLPLPYSRENAERVLRDLPDFRELVANLASEMATFRAQHEAAAEKNSPATSDGTSNGESS